MSICAERTACGARKAARHVPIYVYENQRTGEREDFVFRAADRPRTIKRRGDTWKFDEVGTYAQVQTQSTKGWPCDFLPLSVHPEQVKEARKLFPGREYRNDGTCVARDWKHMKSMAKSAGLEDISRQRNKPRTSKKLNGATK